MKKSVLNLYLQKVAAGDESYLDKLLLQLGERLIYIPILEKLQSSGQQGLKVNIVRLKEAHRSVVPVFTSERELTQWCGKEGYANESISLLGSDLAAALKSETWLRVNPGSEDSVELQPFLVKKLVGSESESEVKVVSAPEISSEKGEIIELKDVLTPKSSPVAAPLGSSEAPQQTEPPKKERRSFLSFLKNK